LVSFAAGDKETLENGILAAVSKTTTMHQQTSLNINEARDNGVAVASGGPYVDHLHMATVQTHNHASTSSLNFLQAICFSSLPNIQIRASSLNDKVLAWLFVCNEMHTSKKIANKAIQINSCSYSHYIGSSSNSNSNSRKADNSKNT